MLEVLIEEYVAECIAERAEENVATIIASATERFPDALAIEAAFAFVSVASALEQSFFVAATEQTAIVSNLYRSIAVFTADIYAVEKLYGPSPKCSQIAEFWVASSESFFASVKSRETLGNLN